MYLNRKMSSEEIQNKLSLVIRRPQEGKTFICIKKILNDNTSNLHIVLTMNTLSSGMQFFGRMEKQIGSENIIVFNIKDLKRHLKIIGHSSVCSYQAQWANNPNSRHD